MSKETLEKLKSSHLKRTKTNQYTFIISQFVRGGSLGTAGLGSLLRVLPPHNPRYWLGLCSHQGLTCFREVVDRIYLLAAVHESGERP